MSEREDVMYRAGNERFKNKRSQILTSLSDRFGELNMGQDKASRSTLGYHVSNTI